jgi:hypothetical protein
MIQGKRFHCVSKQLKKIIHGKEGKELIEIPAFLLQILGDTR